MGIDRPRRAGDESVSTWDDPEDFGREIMGAYRRNKWAGQSSRVIVVSEKGTVRGTLQPVLDAFEVDFLPVGGYASATRVWDLAGEVSRTTPLVILYLGDFDPSGMGMSEVDLPRRLVRYSSGDPSNNTWTDAEVQFLAAAQRITIKRVAVQKWQTRTLLGSDLSFPARDKRSDPRYRWFVEHYGPRCWELDAMNRNDLRGMVEHEITARLDRAAWDRYVVAEKTELASIVATIQTWNGISKLVSK